MSGKGDTIAATYVARVQTLRKVAARLQTRVTDALHGLAHIDRISFREKDPVSFARKSVSRDKDGKSRYEHPLSEVEDQLGGRVLVFFRRDIDRVVERLKDTFSVVEYDRKRPEDHSAFSYESDHFIFVIPPDVQPADWGEIAEPPTTFEMQVRTLFMHAWAEPQHNLGYKPGTQLTDAEKRSLAWAASNAWGGDEIFERVLTSITAREPHRQEPRE